MTLSVEGPRFRSATYCVEVQTPADLDPSSPNAGGLLFWRVDNRSYFIAIIYPDGTYLVTRLVGGSWNNLSPPAKFDKLKVGAGAVNEIKLTALNGHLTLHLNGARALEARAQPPIEGGQMGVYAGSAKTQASEWRFRNVTVTGVANPAGRYTVSGNASGINPYQGSVTVEKAGGLYRVTRSINGRTVEGLGVLEGDMLSVSYREPGMSVIAVYVVSEQGWTGTVTSDKTVSETWLRQ